MSHSEVMENFNRTKNTYFYAIGISYQKADAALRGKFSLTDSDREKLYEQALTEGFVSLMVISTCNRTELYGFAEHPFKLIKLLCDFTRGEVNDFQQVGYVMKSHEAVSHFFNVATGIDSQILGDFEIISQIKKSFLLSKKHHLADAFLERLANAAIQASKKIKSETGLSSGATSISFASVKYILENASISEHTNILLYGTGKIGRNTCENLVKHISSDRITLINRTRGKAEKLAGKFDLVVKDYSQLKEEVAKADILVVATGAPEPTICPEHIAGLPKLILDLSIPKNVSTEVGQMPGITLVHMDELSKITDETLEKRKSYLPDARAIIADIQGDFEEWVEGRKFAPALKTLKQKLEAIKADEIEIHSKKISDFNFDQAEILCDRIIHKLTTLFANHLKTHPQEFDDYVSFIQSIFATDEELKHEKNL